MSKIFVVFGATGQQGGSMIDCVLSDPELSKEYSLRAVTRDVSKPAAQKLQQRGVEVVAGDVDDAASLPAALDKAHTVFLVTYSVYDGDLKSREFRQAKGVADDAVASGAQYIIFSSCVAAERLWGQTVPAFDSKAEIEAYIRTLPLKSAFFAPGMFMQNFLTTQRPQPIPGSDGEETTYAIANFLSPDTPVPCIETVHDGGKYVGAILAEPEKYAGSVFCASTGFYSYRQCAEIITRITGKKTIYTQLSQEKWASFLPPGTEGPLTAMFQFMESHGYFGPESKEKVEWAVSNARGKLTTFEEFVEKHAKELFP